MLISPDKTDYIPLCILSVHSTYFQQYIVKIIENPIDPNSVSSVNSLDVRSDVLHWGILLIWFGFRANQYDVLLTDCLWWYISNLDGCGLVQDEWIEWFDEEENDINQMLWLLQSPDPNPIENLWMIS